MIRTLAAATVLSAMVGMVGATHAQRLSGNDRLLLYYFNFWQGRNNTTQLQRQQLQLNQNLSRFQNETRQNQLQMQRSLAPLDRAITADRRGYRGGTIQERLRLNEPAAGGGRRMRPTPSIYGGGGFGGRQYFGRYQNFNPPASAGS